MKPLVSLLLVWLSSLSVFAAKAKDRPIAIAWQDIPRLDPRYATSSDSQYYEDLVHCSLLSFDAKGDLAGNLAKSWRWIGPKKLELTIRSDAKFSDGQPVTLQDVKASYEFFLSSQKVPSPRAQAFRALDSIKVLDKNRLLFELRQADASFITNLVVGTLKASQARQPAEGDGVSLLGCGPYRLASKKVGRLDLVANPHYFKAKPKLGVTIKVIKQESTRFAKLQTGELDLVQNGISHEKLKRISQQKNLKMIKRPALKTSYIGFNFKDKLLTRLEVRKAINLAINRPAILKHILKDQASYARGLLTPGSSFAAYPRRDSRSQQPRLKEATDLLDQAGLRAKGGVRFRLSLKTTQDRTRRQIAMAVASDLAKIGIKVVVETLEWGRFKSDVDHGRVQMWMLTWIGFKDPDIFRYAFARESWPPGGANRGWFANKKLDQLLGEGLLALDLEQRRAVYHKVQKIVADELPYVFLFHEFNTVVMRSELSGFDVYADGRYSALPTVYRR